MEDKDLFSYDNSNNIVNDGESSFDLNSFSTKTDEEEQTAKPPKKRKQKVWQIILTCFLVETFIIQHNFSLCKNEWCSEETTAFSLSVSS